MLSIRLRICHLITIQYSGLLATLEVLRHIELILLRLTNGFYMTHIRRGTLSFYV